MVPLRSRRPQDQLCSNLLSFARSFSTISLFWGDDDTTAFQTLRFDGLFELDASFLPLRSPKGRGIFITVSMAGTWTPFRIIFASVQSQCSDPQIQLPVGFVMQLPATSGGRETWSLPQSAMSMCYNVRSLKDGDSTNMTFSIPAINPRQDLPASYAPSFAAIVQPNVSSMIIPGKCYLALNTRQPGLSIKMRLVFETTSSHRHSRSLHQSSPSVISATDIFVASSSPPSRFCIPSKAFIIETTLIFGFDNKTGALRVNLNQTATMQILEDKGPPRLPQTPTSSIPPKALSPPPSLSASYDMALPQQSEKGSSSPPPMHSGASHQQLLNLLIYLAYTTLTVLII